MAVFSEFRKANAYKTALCQAFKESGFCSYGPACRFAHGEQELRLPPQVIGFTQFSRSLCKFIFWQLFIFTLYIQLKLLLQVSVMLIFLDSSKIQNSTLQQVCFIWTMPLRTSVSIHSPTAK